jgi:tyrosine-protein phosphatase SIW14
MLYTPPVNFGMVTHNLYRSSFPQKENFAFLRKLGLKSVLYAPFGHVLTCRTLVQEPYPSENLAFLESAGIQFFQFPIPGNKEPFVVIPDVSIIGALETILDKRNHPILVHCNAGKVNPYSWALLTVASDRMFNGDITTITGMGLDPCTC